MIRDPGETTRRWTTLGRRPDRHAANPPLRPLGPNVAARRLREDDHRRQELSEKRYDLVDNSTPQALDEPAETTENPIVPPYSNVDADEED